MRKTKTRAAFAVAAVLVVVGAVVGCGGVASKVAGPSAEREGQTWTHRELAEHLRSRGLQFKEEASIRGGAYGTPMLFDFGDGQPVLVLLMETPQKARDRAGANPGSYAWGRFHFDDNRAKVELIRKAMD